MKLHILGAGSVGSIVAAHLGRQGVVDVRLLRRPQYRRPSSLSPQSTRITVERPGVSDLVQDVVTENVPRLDATTHNDYLTPHDQDAGLFFPTDPICSLLIATKAKHTISAISPILSRLSSTSTITILQNGMGSLENLISTCFPEPDTRPNFVLAYTTIGANRPDPAHRPLRTILAGKGSLLFSLVPNENTMRAIESAAGGSGGSSSNSGGNNLLENNPIINPSSLEELSLQSHLPLTPHTQTLHNTVSALLALKPLDPHWLSSSSFQVKQMSKLAINCVINPLTGIMNVPNGALWRSPNATSCSRRICNEASAVFASMLGPSHDGVIPFDPSSSPSSFPSSNISPLSSTTLENPDSPESYLSIPSAPHPSQKYTFRQGHPLHPDELYATCDSMMKSTSKNISSTLADIRRSQNTEIDYLNGFISRTGRMYGIPTPVNDTMADLVHYRQQLLGPKAGTY